MNVIEAIHARQSCSRLRNDPVPRDAIERLLDAAVQAPNHYRVRPWRFVVLRGRALDRLGEVMADAFARTHPQAPAAVLERERLKPRRAPLIIVVAVDRPTEARVSYIENICAAAAACQNVLLAATELGLASFWRTGDAARESRVREFLGLAPDQEIIAFLYLGYADAPVEVRDRPGHQDRTVWMDE